MQAGKDQKLDKVVQQCRSWSMACCGSCSPPVHHLCGQLQWPQCGTLAVVVDIGTWSLILCVLGCHMNVYTD